MEIGSQNNISKAPFFYISKLEAAKRQLEMAIRLHFNHEDIVAIHSLTWSAYNLLSDLGKKQGIKSILNFGLDYISQEKRSEVRNILHRAGNYFKHADKDPDTQLQFYFKATDTYLLDACQMYQTITKESPPLIIVYRMWYHLSNPGMLDSNNEKMLENARRLYEPNNRTHFFNLMLPIATAVDKTIKR